MSEKTPMTPVSDPYTLMEQMKEAVLFPGKWHLRQESYFPRSSKSRPARTEPLAASALVFITPEPVWSNIISFSYIHHIHTGFSHSPHI